MEQFQFKIRRITIAVTNIQAMVNFYNAVFNCNLQEIKAYGTCLYSGKFGEFDLLLCPNEIAGVIAEQNRQQFDVEVINIDKIIEDVLTTGGKLIGEMNETETQKMASVSDPDGNTIVFIENR